MSALTPHDIRVLGMLAGDIKPEWGAAVNASLEFLAGKKFATEGPEYTITEAGRQALARWRAAH